jgi:hypothetical protein
MGMNELVAAAGGAAAFWAILAIAMGLAITASLLGMAITARANG